ncbi:MAG: response regulator [Calditrichota bacterium]
MDGLKVLLIDDEEELVTTLAERLEWRGFSVHWATNGADAIQKLKISPYEIILLDLKMPGLGGLDLLKIIKRDYPDLPVIILTGHGSLDGGKPEVPEGVAAYLAKPINLDDLIARMKEAVEREHHA